MRVCGVFGCGVPGLRMRLGGCVYGWGAGLGGHLSPALWVVVEVPWSPD